MASLITYIYIEAHLHLLFQCLSSENVLWTSEASLGTSSESRPLNNCATTILVLAFAGERQSVVFILVSELRFETSQAKIQKNARSP